MLISKNRAARLISGRLFCLEKSNYKNHERLDKHSASAKIDGRMEAKIEISENDFRRFQFLESLYESHRQFAEYVERFTRRKGSKVVAVDFDGTIVKHAYPEIGETVPHAFEGLRAFQRNGWKIILYTMRSGEYLEAAVELLASENIELYGVNTNPTQRFWTESTKCYAPLYIDDAALGCPLIFPPDERPFVNWRAVFRLMNWETEE